MPQDPWDQAAAEYKAHAAPATQATSAPAAPNEDWKVWQQTGDTGSSEKPWNDRASAYISDPSMTPDPENTWKGQLERFGQGAAEGITSPILHPIDTARALLTPSTDPLADIKMLKNAATHPANTAGQIAGGAILGRIGGGLGEAGNALHEFAAPDVEAAAMRGLRIPAGSKNANRILGNVETAKPYLKGVKSLEELQERIPSAKEEVYTPFSEAIEQLKDEPLGNSTVGDLYARDKEITAQLGQIKNDPIAMQQAAQKGLNQADLIAEQRNIRSQLFPMLEKHGIDATGINKTYGALKGIEKQVAGKNTILVPDEPAGFGRMRNLSLKQPLKAFDEIKPGAKDVLNGRFWSVNPVETGIEDAFKAAGQKPNFGNFSRPSSPLGDVSYPISDTTYSRTFIPSTEEPEMGAAHPGVIEVGPDGKIRLPQLRLPAPKSAGQLPSEVLPRVTPKDHGEIFTPRVRPSKLKYNTGNVQ